MKPRTMLLFFLSVAPLASAEEPDSLMERRMQWFADAKLGIFIHWGIYAVNGIDESWSFYNGLLTYEDYMKQLNGFASVLLPGARYPDRPRVPARCFLLR